MTWLFFIALTILIYSTKNLFHRVLMKEEHSDPYAQSIVYYSLAGLIALVISFFNGGFQYQLTPHQLLLLIPLAILTTIGPVLLFKSFKLIESSENSIIQTSQNIWTVTGSFLLLHEAFSMKTVGGTLLIVIGISLVIWEGKRFKFNQGVILALLAAVFYSASDLLSYYLVRDIRPSSLVVYVCFLPVITLLFIKPDTLKKVKFYYKRNRAITVIWLALASTLGTVFSYMAYRAGGNVGQITVLLGLTTIISVLLSIIFLNERKNLWNKIIGGIIVVGGALLVV